MKINIICPSCFKCFQVSQKWGRPRLWGLAWGTELESIAASHHTVDLPTKVMVPAFAGRGDGGLASQPGLLAAMKCQAAFPPLGFPAGALLTSESFPCADHTSRTHCGHVGLTSRLVMSDNYTCMLYMLV